MKENEPDFTLAAVCGLFCKSCTVYIATLDDPARLNRIANAQNTSADNVKCEGCRTSKRNTYCNNCFMFKCAAEKGIDFCALCNEFPCPQLKEFQTKFPHRLELWKDAQKIKTEGYKKWFLDSIENYTCKQCGTINSGWDIKCRKCGNTPSCNYVENNLPEIKRRMGLS